MTKIFEKSGSFCLNFKSDNFERQIKNILSNLNIEISESEKMSFYEVSDFTKENTFTDLAEGPAVDKVIKNSYFDPKIDHNLVKMTKIEIRRQSPIKIGYFLSPQRLSDLKGSPDPSHFIFEIYVGKRRI